jgi:hypothetical protein
MPFDSPTSRFSGLRSFAGKGGAPITTTILIINGISFLLAFIAPVVGGIFENYVAFVAPFILPHAWTMVTYPLVYLDVSAYGLLNFLFAGYLFYIMGGSLERSWGGGRYVGFLSGTSIISALSLSVGCWLFRPQSFPLFGVYLPAAASAVAFALIRPDEMFCFFFTMKRKYFAALVALFVWVSFGQGGHAVLGLSALGGLVAAYVYTVYGRSWSTSGYSGGSAPGKRALKLDFDDRKPLRRYPDGSFRRRPYDLVGKWRDAQERKKLDRLLKNSGFNDSEWHEDDRRR